VPLPLPFAPDLRDLGLAGAPGGNLSCEGGAKAHSVRPSQGSVCD